jgi:aspartate-semialdehyde dehydrogenase
MVRVGIFGATGAVGREIVKVLDEKKFPCDPLRLFASSRSSGKSIESSFGKIVVEDSAGVDFSGLDLAFFAVSGDFSRENAQKAVDSGCVVIDNSSAFRYDEKIPLVVPQINAESIGNSKLIANPNCTTAIAAIPLFEIYKKYGIKRVVMSTYQAASGAGSAGMDELKSQTRSVLDSEEIGSKVFQHQLAFNIIPHIDEFQDNRFTKEEMKVVWETRKIFGDSNLRISSTCVRIPIFRVHCESISVETDKEVNVDELRRILTAVDGIDVKDDPENGVYPMPLSATCKNDVEVGRLRKSLVFDNGVDFFVAGDQLLRGAALNAIEIAQRVFR